MGSQAISREEETESSLGWAGRDMVWISWPAGSMAARYREPEKVSRMFQIGGERGMGSSRERGKTGPSSESESAQELGSYWRWEGDPLEHDLTGVGWAGRWLSCLGRPLRCSCRLPSADCRLPTACLRVGPTCLGRLVESVSDGERVEHGRQADERERSLFSLHYWEASSGLPGGELLSRRKSAVCFKSCRDRVLSQECPAPSAFPSPDFHLRQTATRLSSLPSNV